MHEVGVAKEILKIALAQAGGKKIVAMKIELGNDGHTTPESLRHAFSHVAANTPAQGARLDIAPVQVLESRVVDIDVEG